jgi:hypothetical protein
MRIHAAETAKQQAIALYAGLRVDAHELIQMIVPAGSVSASHAPAGDLRTCATSSAGLDARVCPDIDACKSNRPRQNCDSAKTPLLAAASIWSIVERTILNLYIHFLECF